MISPPLPVACTDNYEEFERIARNARMFKLALSLLSPEEPSRGVRLIQKAFQTIQDRAECAEREAAELHEEIARLKQGKALQE